MSAVVVTPRRPVSIVRILCSRCDGPGAKHADCPGVVYGAKVRFICTCPCHLQPVLAFKETE